MGSGGANWVDCLNYSIRARPVPCDLQAGLVLRSLGLDPDPLAQIPGRSAVDQDFVVFGDNCEPTFSAREGGRPFPFGQYDLVRKFGAIHLGETHDKERDDR